MPELVALLLPGGPDFVAELQRIWDDGNAVLPLDPAMPRAAIEMILTAVGPTKVVETIGAEHRRSGGWPTEVGDALVVATSGSTGTPKGVVHTHDSVAGSAAATNAGQRSDPAVDRFLCSMPVNHVAGLSVITRALAIGAPVEVLPHFDAAAVEAAARERGATVTTLVPTALARIDAALFRVIVVGGMDLPPVLAPNVLRSYGLTETGSAVCYDGRPLPGAEVRIVNDVIEVRGTMLFRAYRDGRTPFDPEGWFSTGDRGEWTDDGSLRVLGRSDDLIITGGENVWPDPVERLLLELPDVADVAIVGRADPEWGQRVVAVVVPADANRPPLLDTLRSTVKDRLEGFRAPRELVLVTSLPRTHLGKIQHRAVAEALPPDSELAPNASLSQSSMPPSTTTVVPVVQEERSDAR